MHTQLCDLLEIKYPILQGGMAWIADGNLAAAVANAGGVGLIAAGNAPADWVRAQIREAQAKVEPGGVFGVNIMLMSPFAPDVAKVVVEEGVKVVTTGAGNPAPYMKDWLAAEIKVIPVVPSVAMARLAERTGACAVIAEGGEAGGHVGDLTTMVLVPQVVDIVSIPVIAAGGIADGRGVAAAFMLGASGVQVGTRFLVAHECNVHPTYKQKILKAKDRDTMATGKRLGHPVRSLKTPFSRDFAAKEYDASVTNEELETFGAGSLRAAAVMGDEQNGCFMAGQSAAMVLKEQSAREIIDEMFIEATEVITTTKARFV